MILMKHLIVVGMLGLAALSPLPARAASQGIEDGANFFSDEARKKAQAAIDGIHSRYRGKEVVIETLAAAPAGQTPSQVADQKILAVNGLYILIVKAGGYVRVRAGDETGKLFTDSVNSNLAQDIEKGLRSGRANWDQTLLATMNSIEGTFARGARALETRREPSRAASRPVRQEPASGSSSSGIFGWVVMGAVILIIFFVVRSLLGRRGGSGGGPGYGGYGGGGWGSSILGGLFGAVAGNWIYDQFRGGASADSSRIDSGRDEGSSGSDWTDHDSGSGSTGGDAGGGGDFGDSGGGGDFGGGGDSGGGGDFG